MSNIININNNLSALQSGVFPWNETIGDEFVEKTSNIKADTVVDLCAGSGHLGMTIAEVVRAKKVFLIDIDHISCQTAKALWRSDNFRQVSIYQTDIGNLTPMFLNHGLVVSNPPCAPLPGSLHLWRNVYGGRDGLLYVRKIFKWLSQCQGHIHFFIATYLLSQRKELSIVNIQRELGTVGITLKNIYHFRKPAWNWIGICEKNNPGRSEEIFNWYIEYCQNNEKDTFKHFLKERPCTHNVLLEGKISCEV